MLKQSRFLTAFQQDKNLWPKLRNTVIPEQNAITLSARAVKKTT